MEIKSEVVKLVNECQWMIELVQVGVRWALIGRSWLSGVWFDANVMLSTTISDTASGCLSLLLSC